MSLFMVGDNSLVGKLRILSSLELFLNYKFYYDHPCIKKIFDQYGPKSQLSPKLFETYNSVFQACVSDGAINKDPKICEETRQITFGVHFLCFFIRLFDLFPFVDG